MDGNFKGLNIKVLREFGLSGVTNAADVRREKTGFVCTSGGRDVLIQKPRGDKSSLLFAHYIKEKLYENGFSGTDRFFVTENGCPYFEYNGDIYTASMHLEGFGYKKPQFDDYTQVAKIAGELGRMHKLTAVSGFFDGFSGNVPRRREYEAFTAADGFDKQAKIMQGYKKLVKRQSRLSDFDVSFLKYYNGYEELVSQCAELTPHKIVGETAERADIFFSHNMIKEESVLIGDDVLYITYFDECSGDHFLFDLASIVKRYLRMACPPVKEGLAAVMDAYMSLFSLDIKHLRALYAILLFPDRFVKSCVKYYSKKRSWTPASFCISSEGIGGDDLGVGIIRGYFNGLV